MRFTSPVAIQRNTYDGQAKACWAVVQVGYTRLLFRKFWFKDQNSFPAFWLRLWAPSQGEDYAYHRRWFSLALLGRSVFHFNPDRGYCGR